MAGREFYYNLATGEVEEGKVHGATNRMGPYPTAEDARAALRQAEARNEKWDAADAAWEEDTEE
ncbi:SPOR domain-containing protein [Georgenia yuyongxinii]|uniref:SPOR domain-containing protein n=1 Tax=Georgenia yuyongxinii TaxID=2589797 RepID=A0A552WW95_9MICO|nr:SPOR domain-containing protein [Georgenia yuyongxinii]TRW46859.1 SPOR domain-containing protein [Georgenia yuyongxinii]